MSEQLSFGGFDSPQRATPRDGGKVYFALLPDEAASARCALCAWDTQRQNGLRGKIKEGEFHVSLHGIGSFTALTEDLVAYVKRAVAGVSAVPFEIEFDRVMSFGSNAVVLAGPERHGPLGDLFDRLGLALGRPAGTSFTPHLTLFYADRPMAERWVERIGWTVRDFVLVHSHRGHKVIGRWPLREPSGPTGRS